jgi:uncharacterized membrane protein
MDRFGNQPFPRLGGGGFVERVGGGPSDLAWVIFSLLLVLLLLVIVSLAVDLYFRSQGQRTFTKWVPPGVATPGSFHGGRALAVLDDRYARGDIGRDDFLRTRADLGGAPYEADEPTEVIPPEPSAPERPEKRSEG